ncbi:Hypothetical predicted protein [Cloeon dipterum]|uniref:DUF4773 domain-containing protein n=1 Tax=Cloeon dipterum TaxID=197152 RepID=A0A8S1DSW4_9INSE|nr:Hypothetical predicted protein [Cloeon dipterum]
MKPGSFLLLVGLFSLATSISVQQDGCDCESPLLCTCCHDYNGTKVCNDVSYSLHNGAMNYSLTVDGEERAKHTTLGGIAGLQNKFCVHFLRIVELKVCLEFINVDIRKMSACIELEANWKFGPIGKKTWCLGKKSPTANE